MSTSTAEVEECIKLQSLFLNKSQLIITPLELGSLNLDKVLTQLTLSKSIYLKIAVLFQKLFQCEGGFG